MPHPFSHRPDPDKKKPASEAPTAEAAAAPPDASLAGFALLADPGTIAGDAPPADANEEVYRLRAALHLRSQELEALQANATPTRDDAPTDDASPAVDTTENADRERETSGVPPRPGLLDAASARRLAAEARKRERESREALEAAQQALGDPGQATSDPGARNATSWSGWKRRELVARPEAPHPPESAAKAKATATVATPTIPDAAPPHTAITLPPSATRTDAHAPAAEAPARATLDPDDTIRALGRELKLERAENRERAATLELARETTRRQREEIERLREALREREAAAAESPSADAAPRGPSTETDPQAIAKTASEETTLRALDRDDSVALATRVAALEAELAERDAERRRFEATLADARVRDTQHRERLDGLRDRLEAQDRALDAARREYELERQRHTRSRRLITRLQTTLSTAGATDTFCDDVDPASRLDAAPAIDALDPVRGDAARPPVSDPWEGECAIDGSIPHEERTRETVAPAADLEDRRARARLFDDWLDDQVRRHFGPMGIDRLSDVLTAPLARRTSAADAPTRVLLIGPDAWLRAAALAEGLIASRPESTEVHVADSTGGPGDLAIDADSPLREVLVPTPSPTDAAALEALLEDLRPAVVVSHSALAEVEDPEAWLSVLEAAAQRRSALLFVEPTGVAPAVVPDEVRAVGDRIWSLLPARYAKPRGAETAFPSWASAFDAATPGRPNALFEQLRARFRLELSARFGFLVAPFLHAGLAANFDVAAPRDRRFLEQVADLDERRIEAGEAPALHGLALIDPLAED
ncbi:MAG: hypothetical protein AAGC67_12320 [Myxococcota bacterium]